MEMEHTVKGLHYSRACMHACSCMYWFKVMCMYFHAGQTYRKPGSLGGGKIWRLMAKTGYFFNLPKFILAKELLYACEAWSIVIRILGVLLYVIIALLQKMTVLIFDSLRANCQSAKLK